MLKDVRGEGEPQRRSAMSQNEASAVLGRQPLSPPHRGPCDDDPSLPLPSPRPEPLEVRSRLVLAPRVLRCVTPCGTRPFCPPSALSPRSALTWHQAPC